MTESRVILGVRGHMWKETVDAQGSASLVSVLICTLNEEPNLARILPRILSSVHEVILVDGHSTDGTVQVAKQLRPDIRIIYQPGEGKGDALRYGIQQATGDIVVTLDADGSTDPADIPRFVEPLLRGYDFAKGSRFRRGLPRKKPKHRILGNWIIVMTFNLLYRTFFTDLCSGYNAFWKSSIERVNLDSADGLEDEPLINCRAKKAGLRMVEVGHFDLGRIHGDTKAPSWRQGFRAVRTVVRERYAR